MATKTSVSNQGLLDTAAQDTIPDWMKDLQSYQTPNVSVPNVNIPDQPTATDIQGGSLEANIAAAPSLEKISQILSNINQQAYMAAPGRQEALSAIQGRVAGNLSPETIAENQLAAAQTYGGGGFGVDSPAWQSAIRRATGIDREQLIGQGLGELQSFYQGMPTVDIQKYTLTPSEYAQVQDTATRNRLALAELQQKGSISQAELTQQAALERARLGQALQAQQQQYSTEQAKLAAQQAEEAARLAFERERLATEQKLSPAEAAKLYAGLAWDPLRAGRWAQFAGYGSQLPRQDFSIQGPLPVGIAGYGNFGSQFRGVGF